MKTLLIATGLTLLARARARAGFVVDTLAQARVHRSEDYASNAGGWN